MDVTPSSPNGSTHATSQEAPDVDNEPNMAPRYEISQRMISAIEVPANVQNADRAIQALGRASNLSHVLDPSRYSIPLYLNPDDPFCSPILSHNAPSHNVVLKVTIPKRTGRRRKRGSTGPWQTYTSNMPESDSSSKVCSIARLDSPALLKEKLGDAIGKHTVEAVGTIDNTHRFRGLADFIWNMSDSQFAQDFKNKALSGDAAKLRDFHFQPGIDHGPNADIIPPPIFTHMNLPFNYQYSQNPYVRATEGGGTVNLTAVKQVGYFIRADEEAPTGPQHPPDMTDPRTVEVIAQLEEAFEERPVWTRRSLLNHMRGRLENWNELKKYLNYAAYQFKGGPWRDGVVPYGIDPRTDPKYRIYQTLMFKLHTQRTTHAGQTWQSLRRDQDAKASEAGANTHVFDGDAYHTDGKVWQVCDITDPLLRELLQDAAVRETCDVSSGWYHGGRWAKVKAIMKTKLVALQFGRILTRADFAATLRFGDMTPARSNSTNFNIPLPDLHLTKEELTILHGREPPKKRSQGYNIRLRTKLETSTAVDSSSLASANSTQLIDATNIEENDSEMESDEQDNDDHADMMDDDTAMYTDDYGDQ